MTDRYQIALKKKVQKKEDEASQEVQQAPMGEVEILDGVKVTDRNPKKERELLLSSLLNQAIEETGVSVQATEPIPEEIEFQERVRALTTPQPTRDREENHLQRLANLEQHAIRRRRVRIDEDSSLSQNEDGVITTLGPGSRNLTIRCPSGRAFTIPVRFLEVSANAGTLILQLPGNTAHRIVRDIQDRHSGHER